MKVAALAPWYGSKRSMAQRVVEALGKHVAYWEPFCGSCAVLLAKPESSHETINDLHGDLTNLAWVLQSDRWAELHDRCARAVLCEDVFLHAEHRLAEPFEPGPEIRDQSIDRAYWFVVRSWWGRNGLTGAVGVGNSLAVRFTSGGGHGGVRFRSVVASMPAWHERLRSVLILRRDAFDLVESIADQDGTAIYCDPPYLTKSAKYQHDFAVDDHRRLADLLRRFEQARVVVSYYDHPALAELYDGWGKVDCTKTKNMAYGGENRPGPGERPIAAEVLLINQPAAKSLF